VHKPAGRAGRREVAVAMKMPRKSRRLNPALGSSLIGYHIASVTPDLIECMEENRLWHRSNCKS
jgi:hypothetical protein